MDGSLTMKAFLYEDSPSESCHYSKKAAGKVQSLAHFFLSTKDLLQNLKVVIYLTRLSQLRRNSCCSSS